MPRKVLSFMSALTLAVVTLSARGEMVGEETASAAASGFLSKSSVAKRILAGRSVDSVEACGNVWIVRLAPSGYIEIAGSTKCTPILSFSEYDFAEPEVDSPLAAKLSSDTLMVEAKEADESLEDNADWAKYTATKTRRLLAAAPSGTDSNGCDPFVAPMLGATWHQTAPYNDLSPYNYFCGCMATAAGQELRYWRWPYRCENFRSSAHGVRDAQNNYHTLNLHINGLVPFDWDKIKAHYRDESNASTPWANDKKATYNAAYLTLWAQSLTGMGYKPGGSGGTQQLASNAEIFGYEGGRVYTYWGDGYTNLWNAIKADLDWGSPIQINTAAHQMVIDGYAVENYGEADEVDYINLNIGYGNAIYWDNLKTAVTSGTYSGTLAAFQTGYRPQKIVQFEPVPKVVESSFSFAWHIAPCYTNKISRFDFEIFRIEEDAEIDDSIGLNSVDVPDTNTGARFTKSVNISKVGYSDSTRLRFKVIPVMRDGSAARTNSFDVTIGTPNAAPTIDSVSSVACGIELVQQDIFVECAYGMVNEIKVTCSESTTSLTNYSSHTTIIPDNKISVTKSGNVFAVNVDATDMWQRWSVDGEMIILTMVASNADGTEAYKNLMLRFNSMRQVINGTFDAAEGDSNSAVWFCGDTTIDAKGRAVSFGASAFQGTGKVTLTDSVGGGSFTFAGLDNFRGTLAYAGSVNVTLPSDMTGFKGVLELTSGNYTISSDMSSDATIVLDGAVNDYESVVVNLNSVNWGATVTGWGTINISSGESTFTRTIASNSTLVNLTGGTLNISADDAQYCYVQMNGGTLKVKLTEAQTQLGYNWTLPLYTSGDVKFVLSDNSEESVTAVTGSGLPSISHDTDANIWTGTVNSVELISCDKYSDETKWSKGKLPSSGDYVIFKADEVYHEAGMVLNLASAVNLGYIQVQGADVSDTLTIFDLTPGTSTAMLSADVLENQIETTIQTTYFCPATVIPKRQLHIVPGNPLTCDLESTYADNLKQSGSTKTQSALINSDYWQGRVLLSNQNVSNLEISNYGNAQSKIRFNGVTGWLMGGKTFEGALELVDYEGNPALDINSGSSNYSVIIGSVTSNGTFKTSGEATYLNILLKDISGWTGSFDLASKTIAVGSTVPSSYTGNDGRLHICQAATVNSNATWKADGGLYLGAGGALTVNGAVEAKSVTTYGAGASVTLEDGAVIQVSAASVSDQTPTLTFKAGTFRVKEDSDAFRETSTINFCAASGKRTVIDANGSTLTLGPNVFSGSGDVYLTSSKEGGKIIVEGVPASYTGTIYCDISCGVSFGDLSKATSCNIDVSDITISRSSSDIGNFTIGAGASLDVTVSKAHLMSGLEIDSVTLADGGTLVLRDKDGQEKEYTTSVSKYILPADSSITATPLLDYQFNGNAASTGSDDNATLSASSTITYYESSALYTKHTPWITKEFAMPDDEWTAVICGTLPAANGSNPTMVLMFGANSGNIFGLVAGTGENTVALADRSGLIGSAVSVANATTEYHVYTIVKTAARVRLYVDDVLKVDESKVISVPKKFQFGSVHGSNNSSYAALTGDESRIDYFLFYDFAKVPTSIDEEPVAENATLPILANSPSADGLGGYNSNATGTYATHSTYSQYRIPALAQSTNGVLVALYDCRYTGQTDLPHPIDLAENWSGDLGATWTTARIAVNVTNTSNPDSSTKANDIGDPCILFDPDGNKFWAMGITGKGLSGGNNDSSNADVVLYTRGVGKDDTWQEWTGGPEGNARSVKQMILDSLYDAYDGEVRPDYVKKVESTIRGILQGPGHGITQRRGNSKIRKGTLIFPMQYFSGGDGNQSYAFAVYSQDGGQHWKSTKLASIHSQENSITELDDGSWLMIAKCSNEGKRFVFRSTDYETWTECAPIRPSCIGQGSCLWLGKGVDGKSRYVACFATRSDSDKSWRRSDITLHFGIDDTDNPENPAGIIWDSRFNDVIHPGYAGAWRSQSDNESTLANAYSSLTMVDKNTLGILLETNGQISFRTYDVSTVLSSKLESYAGIRPTAMWTSGEFHETKNGFSITLNDGNATNVTGNIVIGNDATLGATIAMGSSPERYKASMLVKYSLPVNGAPVANAVLASTRLDGFVSNVATNYEIGAICTTATGTQLTGYWSAKDVSTVNSTGYAFTNNTPSVSSGEGYVLFSLWSDQTNGAIPHGSLTYTGSSIVGLTGGQRNNLQWRNFTNELFAIGGPAATSDAKPWAGMEIKAVALFVGQWLKPEDLAEFSFDAFAPESAGDVYDVVQRSDWFKEEMSDSYDKAHPQTAGASFEGSATVDTTDGTLVFDMQHDSWLKYNTPTRPLNVEAYEIVTSIKDFTVNTSTNVLPVYSELSNPYASIAAAYDEGYSYWYAWNGSSWQKLSDDIHPSDGTYAIVVKFVIENGKLVVKYSANGTELGSVERATTSELPPLSKLGFTGYGKISNFKGEGIESFTLTTSRSLEELKTLMKLGVEADAESIKTNLVAKGVNGLYNWQNLILGLDVDSEEKPFVAPEQNADPSSLSFRLGNYRARKDLFGKTATFQVYEVDSKGDPVGGGLTSESEHVGDSASVSLDGVNSVKFFKMKITFE